jgi:hypothetical protein
MQGYAYYVVENRVSACGHNSARTSRYLDKIIIPLNYFFFPFFISVLTITKIDRLSMVILSRFRRFLSRDSALPSFINQQSKQSGHRSFNMNQQVQHKWQWQIVHHQHQSFWVSQPHHRHLTIGGLPIVIHRPTLLYRANCIILPILYGLRIVEYCMAV